MAVAIGGVVCLTLALTLLPFACSAEDGGSLWTRDTLTGDWGGGRTWLADHGVGVQFEFTEYYQGLTGGTGDKSFQLLGRADGFLNFDTGKIGLWAGGGLNTHFEWRSGSATAFRGGALWPVNAGAALPLGEPEQVEATSIYFSQRLGDSAGLMLGKINVVDLLSRDPFFGGWGIHRFMNLAFVAPPSGVVPPVIMGGILNYRFAPYALTLMVFDPDDQTDDYSPKGLFEDGVNLSLAGAWTGTVFDRSASATLTGTYSTRDGTDVRQMVLPADLRTDEKEGSFNVSLQVGHLLLENPVRRGQGLGVYAKAAIADGNPNPIGASFVGGFAGHGIVPSRPDDSFGVGYFYYRFSRDLQDALDPLIEFNDEQGIEAFYSLTLTPWFRLTADLQVIDPSTRSSEIAVIGALRANIVF
jgi:porin